MNVADRRLAIIAGASGAVSIAALVARLMGALSSGIATVVATIAVGVGLKVAFTYAARSASSAGRARIMNTVSLVGLGVSAAAGLAALPRLTQAGGIGLFAADVLAQLWTLAILLVVTGPVRTFGWRVFAGAGLTGFLAITGLARLVGRPLIVWLGTSSILAGAVWVPITEELFKLIPVFLVLAIAVRRTTVRPAALDVMLVGAFTAAGFQAYENAGFGRGGFHLSAVPALSLVFPMDGAGMAAGWTVAQTGHLVHTALLALGIAFVVLYRNRLRSPGRVALVVIAAVLIEHCAENAMATGRVGDLLSRVLIVLILGGWLSSLALVGAVAYVLRIERRCVGAEGWRLDRWIVVPPAESRRRAAALARAQRAEPNATTAAAPVAVAVGAS